MSTPPPRDPSFDDPPFDDPPPGDQPPGRPGREPRADPRRDWERAPDDNVEEVPPAPVIGDPDLLPRRGRPAGDPRAEEAAARWDDAPRWPAPPPDPTRPVATPGDEEDDRMPHGAEGMTGGGEGTTAANARAADARAADIWADDGGAAAGAGDGADGGGRRRAAAHARGRLRGRPLTRVLFVPAAIGVAVWMAVTAMAAATDREAAIPATAALLDVLLDPEALVVLHAPELEAQVAAGAAALAVPGVPGEITIPTAEATAGGALDPRAAAAAFRTAAATRVYDDGPHALFGAETTPRLSDAGSVDALLRALTRGRHDTARTLGWGAGLIALGLLGALATVARSWGRIALPGAAVVVAGVPVAFAGIAVPWVLEVAGVGPGGLLGERYHETVADLSGAAVRHGVIAVAAGSALWIPATIAAIATGGRSRR